MDIEAIKRAKYAYFRCVDTANLGELAELLDENVTATFSGGSYSIKLDGRDAYVELIANSTHSQLIVQHNGHHPEIDVLNETEAVGTWYLSDFALDFRRKQSITGAAFYRDKYRKKDGLWLLTHTAYERVFEIVGEIHERPNVTAHYLATHGRASPTAALDAVFKAAQ